MVGQGAILIVTPILLSPRSYLPLPIAWALAQPKSDGQDSLPIPQTLSSQDVMGQSQTGE